MQAKVKLVFLGVAEFNKKDGTTFQMPVFYDEDSARLIKPFYDDEMASKLRSMKPYEPVVAVLDIFESKSGMGTKLITLAAEQGQAQAISKAG